MTDEQPRLPPILAFEPVLDRIERGTDDADALEWLADVRAAHERLASRAPDRRETVVDEIDGLLESLRTHLEEGGDADRWARTVQYRLATYRRTLRESSETLHLSGQTLEGPEGDPVDVSSYVGEATLTGTLLNRGEPTDATVQLAFYDADGVPVWKVESRLFDLEPGEKRSLSLTVYVPEGVTYHAAAAVAADDPQTVAGSAPTRGG